MKIKSIRNISFRKKLTLIFTLVCTFSTCVAGILYYQYAVKEIVSNFTVNAQSLVGQLEKTLDTRLSAINRRAFAALTNSSFMQPFGNYLSSPDIKKEVIISGEAANWLKDIRLGEPLVNSTMIYTKEGGFDDYTKVRNWDFVFEDSAFQKFFNENTEGGVQWMPTMEDELFTGKEMVIPYVRRFTVEAHRDSPIYLIIQLDKKELMNEITGDGRQLGQILITDSEGRLIASNMEVSEENLEELLGVNENHEEKRYSSDIAFNGENYLMSKGVVDVNNWQVYILKSKKELLDNISHLRKLILGLTFVMVFICIIIVMFLSRQLTSSLQRLALQMNYMRNGEFDARFYYPYKDEVGSLAKTFNYMADEIEAAMKKQEEYIAVLKEERDLVAKVQTQKRKVELQALQAQINPHFLYNTLNTITWLASDKGVDEVRILSNSLGKFFRISLSKGAEEISIRDEVEHVKSYLSIQKIRYAQIMQYEIKIPENLMEYTTLKLVLQPLVENSIYHGIKAKNTMSHILIKAKLHSDADKPDWIELVVEDDGVGMIEEKLISINAGLKKGITDGRDGYGIFNVNERIKLYYGMEYGLYYDSREGVGTKAILAIPAKSREDDVCIRY